MRKGTDLITLDTLKKLGACKEGMGFFTEHHPNGEEYQKVLDTACEFDHLNYAVWLLDNLGPTDDILEVESIDTKKGIVFAGGIHAEREIHAGWEIHAGREIRAGLGIRAGEGIHAGEWYGVYAGLSVKISERERRTVTAKKRPENLMCGEFVEVAHES